jgi:hypothetical protein
MYPMLKIKRSRNRVEEKDQSEDELVIAQKAPAPKGCVLAGKAIGDRLRGCSSASNCNWRREV